MPEEIEIIRARIKDDAAVLIDRLMRSRQPDVVLMLPKNSIIAANPASVKTLLQEAESVGKNLYLSTENREILAAAKAVGMPVYRAGAAVKTPKAEPPKTEKKVVRKMMDIRPPSRKLEVFEMPEEVPVEPPFLSPEIPDQMPEMPVMPEPEIPVYEVSRPETAPVSENAELEKNLESFYSGVKTGGSAFRKKIKFSFAFKHFTAALTAVGGLLLLSAFYLILPRANIKISLKTIPVKTSIPVAVSKSVSSLNLSGGIIPGQYFSLSASGARTIDLSSQTISRYAGTITIFNAYSAAPQKLVAQTRFETKDGKIFRIQNPVTVPGAIVSGNTLTPSSMKVEVFADRPGEEYNIGSAYFTIPGFKGSPKYAGFYAQSDAPMTAKTTVASGQMTAEVLEKAKGELLDELTKKLENETLSAVENTSLKLISGASNVKITEFKSSLPVGAAGSSAALSMKISWQAIVFKESDFKSLANYFITSKYPDLKSFEFEDNISYPSATRADFAKGEAFFTFKIDRENALSLDIDELKRGLAGRDEDEMRLLILQGQSSVNSATISLWPFWVKRAPSAEKINITIDQEVKI